MKKLLYLFSAATLLMAAACGPNPGNNNRPINAADSAIGNTASKAGDTAISAGSGSPTGVNSGTISGGSTGQAGKGGIKDSSGH